MLIRLLVIGFWFSSSATVTGDQIFTELKRISDTASADDGIERLLRLRTCRDAFMIQCEPCEVIRIINASDAVGQTRYRNSTEGCSAVNFHQEFDCLLPAYSQSLEEITGRCNGYQSCELERREHLKTCGSSGEASSCCMEVYYACIRKTDLIESALFLASDAYGNVNNVTLQCQSSDLSVDSVTLAFNSSVQDGGVCYKESPNTNYLKGRCARRGCSGKYVAGSRGCGGDKYVYNYGVYVCYICNGSKWNQFIDVTAQTNGQTANIKNFSANEAETMNPNFETRIYLVSVVSASLIGALLVLLFVGCIVNVKRRRNPAVLSRSIRWISNGKQPETTRGGQASDEEQKDYRYPEMPRVCLQLIDVGNGQ